MTKYLIRFDDICPTMRWSIWEHIERILLENHVTPMLAVIPDNRDSTLQFEPARSNFWERVKDWQRLGWTIGMHGHQHVYTSNLSGLVGIKNASEFAGLSRDAQREKIKVATDLFLQHGIRPDLWIAPGHSFDEVTLEVLREFGINCLSDGFLVYPRVDRCGTIWIPQQLWHFRRLPLGIWTVCFHHNHWTEKSIRSFENDVVRFRKQITSFSQIMLKYSQRRRSHLNVTVATVMRALIRHRIRRASPKTT